MRVDRGIECCRFASLVNVEVVHVCTLQLCMDEKINGKKLLHG